MKQVWQKLFLITLPLATLGSLAPITSVKAQIVPDNTLGAERSVVNGNLTIRGTPSDQIDGGARRGNNLFHSFQEFNVGAGRGAYFSNQTGVDNILTRVTGGNPSNILGRLGVLDGNANLFLINPNGIVFGRNASLDVRGSFFGSTASSLIFNNGFEFSAVNPQAPPMLTVNIPIGLRFRDNPGSISNQSMVVDINNNRVGLQVPSGNTLALLGGDVSLDGGRLTASGGRVELGGLAREGTLGLNVDGNTLSLSFPDGVARGSVSLQNSSNVDVSGSVSGSIAINARNLDLQQSRLRADVRSSSDTPSLRVGDITINATETITLGQLSRIGSTNAVSNAKVMPHNINITTGSLSMMNGSQVSTFTSGQGNAGDVNIRARDNLSFNGASNGMASGIVSIAQPQSTGNAGNVSINTGTLSLTNGAGVFAISNGQGTTGSVTINARDAISLQGPGSGVFNLLNSSNGMGNSGGISIKTGTLTLRNAQLNTSTDGMGHAGDVTIDADRVSLNNGRIFTSANNTATGNGGDVRITSGDISLANGSLIILSTAGSGNAGNAFLTTRSLSLTDGSLLTASSVADSRGNGGAIQIKANESVSLSGSNPINRRSTEISTDTIERSTGNGGNITIDTNAFRLSDGAIINVRTTSNGNAGNITINAKTFEARNGGELVSTSSGSTSAGNIQVHATDWVSVNGSDPTVEERRNIFNASGENLANVEAASGFFVRAFGSGSAGDIQVNAPQIRLDNSGKFSAESESGNGGNINLQIKDLLLLRRQSLISTSAGGLSQGFGNGGNININTPFIISFPSNNDITANASRGSGGNITINRDAILYGINPLSRSELERLSPDLDPRKVPTSDITAISQQNPSLNGTVNINTSYFDPTQSLVELPQNVVDPTKQIAQNPCQQGEGSTFAFTGRGGIPSNPNQTLASDNVRVGLVTPASSGKTAMSANIPSTKPTVKQAVPVQGWVFNDKGQVVLTAYDPTTTISQRPWRTPASCAKP